MSAECDGFRLGFSEAASAQSIAEWMTLEHRSCPSLILELALALKDDGTAWIEMGGNASIKKSCETSSNPSGRCDPPSADFSILFVDVHRCSSRRIPQVLAPIVIGM